MLVEFSILDLGLGLKKRIVTCIITMAIKARVANAKWDEPFFKWTRSGNFSVNSLYRSTTELGKEI